MLIFYICMISVIRPLFEVVKEGRILHFVSGYRRFEGFTRYLILIDILRYQHILYNLPAYFSKYHPRMMYGL